MQDILRAVQMPGTRENVKTHRKNVKIHQPSPQGSTYAGRLKGH